MDKLQVLCRSCHKEKTAEEKLLRKKKWRLIFKLLKRTKMVVLIAP
jgi:5-methylcytosine-specific restriction endonuclease McrA